ncbi:MAG: hypothetical protein LBQ90_00350, partial [Synergistaceae bacterium]|nr:hypothetical protein [Synergistaceae bacterium]
MSGFGSPEWAPIGPSSVPGEKRFQGIAVSRGFADAPVRRCIVSPFVSRGTPCASPDAEIETFRAAFASLQRKLQRLEEDSRERLGQEKA